VKAGPKTTVTPSATTTLNVPPIPGTPDLGDVPSARKVAVEIYRFVLLIRQDAPLEFRVFGGPSSPSPEISPSLSLRVQGAGMTGAGQGMRVGMRRALVAEDSAILLYGLELLLAQLDIEVVGSAATLSSLRELVDSQTADIAILDVNLNGEMVFPVADLLIARSVPIVFVTGYAPDKVFPHHLRGRPIVQKPCDPDEFRRAVTCAITQAKARKEQA
jgi:CheY-like chemotaxis protein